VIRVYLNGVKIVEEALTKRSPIKYLNGLTRSKHFASLERKLMPHALTLSDIGIKRKEKK